MDMKQWLHEQLTAEKRRAMPILSFPAVQLMASPDTGSGCFSL